MVASVILVAAVSGLLSATGFAAAGYSLSTVLAGYFIAGTVATAMMLLLVTAIQRRRTRAQRGRSSRRIMGSA